MAVTPDVLRSMTDHVAAEAGDASLMVMNPAAAIAADRVTRSARCLIVPPDFPLAPRPLVEV